MSPRRSAPGCGVVPASRIAEDGRRPCDVDRGIVTDLTSSLPAPGWYPDPVDPAATRWWSGAAWTAHVAAAPTAPAVPARPVAWPAVPSPEPGAAEAPTTGTAPARPAASAWSPESAWHPDFSARPEPAPYRPFADRDARDPFLPAAAPAWRQAPSPNPAATRAAIAAGVVTVFVVASLVLHVPVGVPLIATGIAIVFGILGIARSRVTLSGLKRSIAALVVGVVALILTLVTLAGALVLASRDYTSDLETSLVDLYNSLEPALEATSAQCAHVEVPRDGDTVPCTVTLVDASAVDVVLTFTSDSGSYIAETPA